MLLTAYYPLPTVHYQLLTIHYSLRTNYFLGRDVEDGRGDQQHPHRARRVYRGAGGKLERRNPQPRPYRGNQGCFLWVCAAIIITRHAAMRQYYYVAILLWYCNFRIATDGSVVLVLPTTTLLRNATVRRSSSRSY